MLQISPIVVSHNSEKYIERFWGVNSKELGCKITIVNSSDNKINLNSNINYSIIEVGSNVGFSAANNQGINHVLNEGPDYFLIANPDVMIPSGWLLKINNILNDTRFSDVGIFSVPLLAYDFEHDRPSGCIDSIGIEHTLYGRWYDVLQGDDVSNLNVEASPYEVSAVCGALMLIHKDTVYELLHQDGYVFDETYFMYKEDIELSLRVRKLDKKILMIPSAPAFHCRGWAKHRADSPYWARELSVRNELKMHLKYYWRYLPYSVIKYIYVNTLERLLY